MNVKWTEEWPTTPGYYWYFGWCWGDRNYAPKLHFVRVQRTGNDGLVYATDGFFLWRSEGGYGVWAIANVPDNLPVLREETA